MGETEPNCSRLCEVDQGNEEVEATYINLLKKKILVKLEKSREVLYLTGWKKKTLIDWELIVGSLRGMI